MVVGPPFGNRDDPGRHQRQPAEQGGDLRVAARRDRRGDEGVIGGDPGGHRAGREVAGQVRDRQEAAWC